MMPPAIVTRLSINHDYCRIRRRFMSKFIRPQADKILRTSSLSRSKKHEANSLNLLQHLRLIATNQRTIQSLRNNGNSLKGLL